MILAEHKLRVFSDDHRQGNDVRVVILSQSPNDSQWQGLTGLSSQRDSQGKPQTICVIFCGLPLDNEEQPQPPLECRWYQGGREVQLCGSGILAAAHALKSYLKISLPYSLKHYHRTIDIDQYGDDDNEHFSFSLPRFQLNEEAVPAIARQWFQHQPIRCMSCGDEQGYWVVEFAEPITVLTPDLSAICTTTQRAIIATSAHAPDGYDYSLRYFAPQYGIDEDLATGSANAVLASYWDQQRQLPTSAHPLQSSYRAMQHQGTNTSSGGSISLHLNESKVWVAGRVTEVK